MNITYKYNDNELVKEAIINYVGDLAAHLVDTGHRMWYLDPKDGGMIETLGGWAWSYTDYNAPELYYSEPGQTFERGICPSMLKPLLTKEKLAEIVAEVL